MAQTIPDGSVVTIDVGHHVHQHVPDQFTQAVLRWMSGRVTCRPVSTSGDADLRSSQAASLGVLPSPALPG
jgi:hypothetical protein